MNMNDMLIISTDDHICEPPDLFDKHLEGDLLKSAPKLLTDRNGKNFWSYQGRHQPGIGLNAVVGRPFEEYGMEPNSLEQLRDERIALIRHVPSCRTITKLLHIRRTAPPASPLIS